MWQMPHVGETVTFVRRGLTLFLDDEAFGYLRLIPKQSSEIPTTTTTPYIVMYVWQYGSIRILSDHSRVGLTIP